MADDLSEAATGAKLVLDSFRLIQDVEEQQWLVNSATGHVRLLEKHAEGLWEMDDVEHEGHIAPMVFIDGTEHEMWAADAFKLNAYMKGAEVRIQGDCLGANAVSLKDFATRRTPLITGLRFPGEPFVHEYRIFKFELQEKCQAFWWSLGPLINKVLLPFHNSKKKVTRSTILAKRLKAWNGLASLNSMPCIRRSRPQSGVDSKALRGEPARCLGLATVSTALFVAILSTLAYKSQTAGGCASPEAAAAAKRELASACTRASLEKLTVRVTAACAFDDGFAVSAPGVLTCTLPVVRGNVDLTELALLELPRRFKATQVLMYSVIDALETPPDTVPLLDFLEAVLRKGLAFYKDIIWNIANGIDRVLKAEVEKVIGAEGLPTGAPREHTRLCPGSGLTTHEMATRNARQMTTARCRMDGALQVSFATDGATVGKKARQNTLFALPDNYAVFGPPVVA